MHSDEFKISESKEEAIGLLAEQTEPSVDEDEDDGNGKFTWKRVSQVVGPGLIVCLADTDAGCIVTAAQTGAEFGLSFVKVQILLIPILYMVQELTIRLGIFTGMGHGQLIKKEFGTGWAWFSVSTLFVACCGAMVTEMAGIAAVGTLCGIPTWASMILMDVALLLTTVPHGYTMVERIALAVGLFELFFFILAYQGLTDGGDGGGKMGSADFWGGPIADGRYQYMLVANIGAVIMPFMIFYQQSAVVDKGLRPRDLALARVDTWIGCFLTQGIMVAVIIAAATCLPPDTAAGLDSVGAISDAFTRHLGDVAGKIIFGLGVAGGSMVAAIVVGCAAAWGLGEVAEYPMSLDMGLREAPLFYSVFMFSMLLGNAVVCVADDKALVEMNVAAEVLNALLLLPVLGFLYLLSMRSEALPKDERLQGSKAIIYGMVFGTVIILCWVSTIMSFVFD